MRAMQAKLLLVFGAYLVFDVNTDGTQRSGMLAHFLQCEWRGKIHVLGLRKTGRNQENVKTGNKMFFCHIYHYLGGKGLLVIIRAGSNKIYPICIFLGKCFAEQKACFGSV
jgi:hypothetical protein